MARRYCGDTTIYMSWLDGQQMYRCRVVTPVGTRMININNPVFMEHTINSTDSYNKAANAALSLAIYLDSKYETDLLTKTNFICVEEYIEYDNEGNYIFQTKSIKCQTN